MDNKKLAYILLAIISILLAVVVFLFFELNKKVAVPVATVNPLSVSKPEKPKTETPFPAETTPPVARSIFQVDGKTARGNGVEAYFEEGILDVNEAAIVFRPKDMLLPKKGEDPTSAPEDIYQFMADNYRIADDIVKESVQSTLALKEPVEKTINGLTVVETVEGGMCENRFAEVVGKRHNYIFASLGCFHNEKEDFASFEKVIATMKLID